jgi:hypothetical protein
VDDESDSSGPETYLLHNMTVMIVAMLTDLRVFECDIEVIETSNGAVRCRQGLWDAITNKPCRPLLVLDHGPVLVSLCRPFIFLGPSFLSWFRHAESAAAAATNL